MTIIRVQFIRYLYYLIKGGDKNTFSHLTIAEINGGIDGLLLGIHAKKESWSSNRHSALTLSQVEIGNGKNYYLIKNRKTNILR